ncbi:hypothetical protein [Microbacterium sp. KNMS]
MSAILSLPRAKSDLQVGDLVTSGTTRWIVRVIDHVTGRVELVSSNHRASAARWTTTLDQLSREGATP